MRKFLPFLILLGFVIAASGCESRKFYVTGPDCPADTVYYVDTVHYTDTVYAEQPCECHECHDDKCDRGHCDKGHGRHEQKHHHHDHCEGP